MVAFLVIWTDNNVKIVDDYGKSIRMTVDQAKMINNALKELGK